MRPASGSATSFSGGKPSPPGISRISLLFRSKRNRGRSLAGCGVEDALAETERLRGRFDEFIGADIFDGALESHLERRFELNAFAFALAPHVRKVFGFAGVHRQIFGPRIFPDNHAGINFLLRADEEFAARL